nr:MAG TPA: hypothetical protein [Caudoviricetes sp.]
MEISERLAHKKVVAACLCVRTYCCLPGELVPQISATPWIASAIPLLRVNVLIRCIEPSLWSSAPITREG